MQSAKFSMSAVSGDSFLVYLSGSRRDWPLGWLPGFARTNPSNLIEVALKDGLCQETAVLRQSGFGITPEKIAGGTVKVKDEMKVMFSLVLRR